MGITPAAVQESAKLPACNDDEVDTFETTINEAFEQMEEPPALS